jgi:hypothetical protein
VGLYFDWSYKCPVTKTSIPAIGLHLDGWGGATAKQRPRRWLRINGLYYHQSVVDGTFFCQTNMKTITFDEALKLHAKIAKSV